MLDSVYFSGNAPSFGDGVFSQNSNDLRIFVNPEASGFSNSIDGIDIIPVFYAQSFNGYADEITDLNDGSVITGDNVTVGTGVLPGDNLTVTSGFLKITGGDDPNIPHSSFSIPGHKDTSKGFRTIIKYLSLIHI